MGKSHSQLSLWPYRANILLSVHQGKTFSLSFILSHKEIKVFFSYCRQRNHHQKRKTLDLHKQAGLVAIKMCGIVDGCLWSFSN